MILLTNLYHWGDYLHTSFGYSNQDTMQLKNVIDHDLHEMDIWLKSDSCHLILTKQKS